MKGFSKSSHQKVHPNFAKNLGRQILGNTFSGPNVNGLSGLQNNFPSPFLDLALLKLNSMWPSNLEPAVEVDDDHDGVSRPTGS